MLTGFVVAGFASFFASFTGPEAPTGTRISVEADSSNFLSRGELQDGHEARGSCVEYGDQDYLLVV